MPKGTKVEEVYQALRREGMSEERAAKIAQAQTGLSLATGKPPKGTENMRESYKQRMIREAEERGDKQFADDIRSGKICFSDSFMNGRSTAVHVVNQKIQDAGIFRSKEVYSKGPYKIFERHSQFGDDFVIHKGSFVVDGAPLFSSFQKAKQWVDAQ